MLNHAPPIYSLLKDVQRIIIQKEAELKATSRYAALKFTPFRFVDSGEVQTTRLLAFFLNEREDHGQGRLFLDAFVQALHSHNPTINAPLGSYSTQVEKRHDGVRQIDLLLRAPGNEFAICVENKLFAADQPGQLADYAAYLQQEFGDTKYLFVYLSPETRTPNESSISTGQLTGLTAQGQYYNITYRDFILPLLDEWIRLAFPEKIKAFLLDFKYHIERTLNFTSTAPAAKMQQDEIADFLLQDTTRLKLAYTLPSAVKAVEKQLRARFIAQLHDIAGRIGLTAHCGSGFAEFGKYSAFTLTKAAWGRHKIGLEFEGALFYYGVIGNSALASLHKELNTKIQPAKSSTAWPWYFILYQDSPSLYLDIAEHRAGTNLQPLLTNLAKALDELAQEGKLQPAD